MSCLDPIRRHAAADPGHPALVVDRGGRSDVIAYGELVGNAEALARRLRAGGVAPGERCGLRAAQGPAFIEWALGILAADACLVPIAEDHRGPQLEAFARQALLHHVLEQTQGGPQLRSLPDGPRLAPDREAAFRALGPAYLRFTSGTTSERKGVVLGHARILERTAAANRALEVGPDDRILWLLPLAHHFVVSILLYLRFGATVLLPSGPLARPILAFAAREGATLLYASPHHHQLLARDASDLALPDVRLAISTADGLRPELARTFAERFGLPLSQALGIIEVGLPVMNRAHAADRPGALGRPLPDYEVWLRGEDGNPLEGPTSPERTGEICIRGPGLLDAYLDPWLPAARLLERGSFRTGDQGWFDAEGNLSLAGRRANRVSMAGMKFFGEEVEAVLDRCPGVRESRVFAKEHPQLGEIPVAEVVPLDPEKPPTPAELQRHCREQLPRYKVPRRFAIVAELARTPTGKLKRT